jgi:hypothetical protein
MEVTIQPVKTRRDLRKFIYLPEKIHEGHETWMPPLYADEWAFFNPKKNRSFHYSDTVLYLAFKGEKVVGRIMGIINHRYNEIHHEQDGRFIFMECYDDQEVAHALITAVEVWAREKGMVRLVGPLGFSDKDPQGFQIEGFRYPSVVAMVGNHPYMPKLIEKEGYVKKVDLHDYYIDVPEVLPKLYQRVYERISNRSVTYEMLEFKTKKELKDYIVPCFRLVNEIYTPIYGFVPMTEKEMMELAKRYLPALNPHFVKVVLDKGEVIAFIVGIPDFSEGAKKAKGRLFPFGFIHILRALKKSRHLVLLLGGIKPEYRNNGLDVLMGIKMLESASKNGMETIESHLILETNTPMIGEVLKVGGRLVKKFRIFQKEL